MHWQIVDVEPEPIMVYNFLTVVFSCLTSAGFAEKTIKQANGQCRLVQFSSERFGMTSKRQLSVFLHKSRSGLVHCLV